MIAWDGLQEITYTLKQNTLRTLLTAFGVFLGVFMLILLLGAGRGLQHGAEATFSSDVPSDMIFEGQVDESEVGKIKEGMNLVLNVGAIGSEKFNAALEYISPKGVADQGTIKFEIRAAVKFSDSNFLRAGYSANADIVLGEKKQALAINEGNLITENKQTFVELMTAPQVFERRSVKTGLSDGINVEIQDGLAVGQPIKKQQ